MNGRLYDPRLGRFLAPDNYVQDPFGTQNFNRYGYALNNPMVYVDPDGEFLLGSIFGFVGGLFKSIFSGGLEFWNADKQYFKDAWSDFGSSVSKGFAIDMGLWKTDSDKSFWGRSWELFSRFTWQAPQMSLGYVGASGQNLLGGVKSVTYHGGATVTETYSEKWGAFALGNYIMGDRGTRADPEDRTFQHEYGHYIQSQRYGPFYINKLGIPSLLSRGTHNMHPVEQDASRRSFNYFEKQMGEAWIDKNWNHIENPINYNVKFKWWDYLSLAIFGTIDIPWTTNYYNHINGR